VRALQLEPDVIGGERLQEDVLALEGGQLFALLLVEQDAQQHFQVARPHTDVREHIWMVASLASKQNDSLHIARDFLLPSDFVYDEASSALVSVEHDIGQILDPGRVAARAIGATLADDEPVAQVGLLTHLRLSLLHDH